MAAGDTMQGARRPDGTQPHEYEPGDYGLWAEGGTWFCRTPSGATGNLSAHSVDEHADGTITVSPSILVHRGTGEYHGDEWHGYLERGVWREV
jgi:hypothetical protein